MILTPGLGWRLRDGQLVEISFSNLTLGAVGMIFGLTGEVTSGRRSGHPDQVVRVLEVYEPLLEVEAAILHIFRGEANQKKNVFKSPSLYLPPSPENSQPPFASPSRTTL